MKYRELRRVNILIDEGWRVYLLKERKREREIERERKKKRKREMVHESFLNYIYLRTILSQPASHTSHLPPSFLPSFLPIIDSPPYRQIERDRERQREIEIERERERDKNKDLTLSLSQFACRCTTHASCSCSTRNLVAAPPTLHSSGKLINFPSVPPWLRGGGGRIQPSGGGGGGGGGGGRGRRGGKKGSKAWNRS